MVWLVVVEIVLLYLLSRALTQGIYRLVYLITTSKSLAISVLSLLFFPGTVIHELSHWFIAELLRVKTGEITFHPVIEKTGVRLGSVAFVRTDPIRRVFVGLAPIFVGLTILLATTQLYSANFEFKIPNLKFLSTLLFFYILFTIGNTMFSSRRDLEGFVVVAAMLGLISFSLYQVGLWPQLSSFQARSTRLTKLLFPSLSLLILLDTVLLLILHGTLTVAQRALKIRVG